MEVSPLAEVTGSTRKIVLFPDHLYIIRAEHENMPGVNKVIFLKFISAIHLKHPGRLLSGSLQIEFMGGIEEIEYNNAICHASDNTIDFRKEQEPDFIKFKEMLEERMAALADQPTVSPLSELEKLAELKDKGVVTEEEFQAKKRQLLGI
jgi:hypothetical protein